MKKCDCIYRGANRIGLCLRCAKIHFKSFDQGRRSGLKDAVDTLKGLHAFKVWTKGETANDGVIECIVKLQEKVEELKS